MRLWTLSALAAIVAMIVVLAVWLVVHDGFRDEATRLMVGYLTNLQLVVLAVVVSALIGLIEAVIMTSWYRRKRKRA